MLASGVDPGIIEQAASQAGYAASPLQVADELSFETMRRIMDATIAAAKSEGTELSDAVTSASEVVAAMLDEFGRPGKIGGAGFYEYSDGKRGLLWDGLRERWNTSLTPEASFEDLQDRMLFSQAIETQKAYDDGVIDSDADANIGSIFGIGFPAWTGGVRQFVTNYPGGREAFLARADELAATYGPRFTVPASMR